MRGAGALQSRGGQKCFACGRMGHISRECPNDRRCYICGQSGHISRDCEGERQADLCYRCNERGHIARHCNRPSPVRANRRNGSGDRKCYHCGHQGHIARDCPQATSSPQHKNSHDLDVLDN